MVTRIGQGVTATFAGRDYRVAVTHQPDFDSVVPRHAAGSGSRVLDALRWVGRLWLEGWKMHVIAVRDRRGEDA